MQYVNHVYDEGGQATLYTAPVAEDDAAYLRRIIAQLVSLSDDNYINGPAVILDTDARFSYVLVGANLYWCVEWEPGLIVICFSPDGAMTWAAVRSPVPNFGNREASDEEWANYDEDANNLQYNLVFTSWDAQFDERKRQWDSFIPADLDIQARFLNALAHANLLHMALEKRLLKDRKEWRDACMRNLEHWCGEGIHNL